MKYFQFKGVLLALLALGLISSSYAQDNSKLTIFVDNSYPPYMYETEATAAEGLYPRLLNEIVRQAGHEADIKAYPWKRALLFSEAGKGAVGGAYKNDERLKTYDFSNPLYQEKLVIFVNKKSTFKYSAIEDLKGKIIGYQSGTIQASYAEKYLKKIEAKAYPAADTALADMTAGRIDYVLMDLQPVETFLASNEGGDYEVKHKVPASVVLGEGIGYAVRKGDKDSLDKIDAALTALKEDGRLDALIAAKLGEVFHRPTFGLDEFLYAADLFALLVGDDRAKRCTPGLAGISRGDRWLTALCLWAKPGCFCVEYDKFSGHVVSFFTDIPKYFFRCLRTVLSSTPSIRATTCRSLCFSQSTGKISSKYALLEIFLLVLWAYLTMSKPEFRSILLKKSFIPSIFLFFLIVIFFFICCQLSCTT